MQRNILFKMRWIAEEDLLAFNNTEDYGINTDSLKTHPDCPKRIKLMIPQLMDYPRSFRQNSKEKDFADLAAIGDFEMIEGYFFFEDFGRCIYHALKLLNKYPDNSYLYAVISKCLYLIHNYQSEHTLGQSVEQAGKHQPTEYQELLRFIHNMRLKELAKVNYYFLAKVKDQFIEDEDFLFAWIMANDLMQLKEVAQTLKKSYFEKYPKGYYYDFLKKHP